jgi:glycosyltransferase involved in cell wall biosynthesis
MGNPSMISIIVCYRNREEHLTAFVPHIRKHFGDQPHEIIVVEQADDVRFRRGNLLNEGAKIARGDVIALHDVDYLPDATTTYWADGCDVFRPAKRVNFVLMDGSPRPEADVPSGYRHFKDGVDDDFFGAVTVFSKSAFRRINGFNPLYDGWGLEDADLRERINLYGLKVARGNGTFSALPHTDSFPGLQDEGFQHNQQIFASWKNFVEFGLDTTFPINSESTEKAARWGVDRWIESVHGAVVTKDLLPYMTVENLTDFYEDDPETHTRIWQNLKTLVNSTPDLKAHRDWVIQNNWGYGNRAFHWMWNILIQQAPKNFKFLEIGVFKGQTISLISLLNKKHRKDGTVYGLTPLSKTGDKYATHPDVDYESLIQQIYGTFQLDANDLNIIQGFSNDPEIIEIAQAEGPYDLVYVDGCHDYEVVVSDLTKYGDMLKVGGYLIVDDSSNHLKIPDGLIRMDWRGLMDVSNAVRDVTEKDVRFTHCFAVGHNRVFQRIN